MFWGFLVETHGSSENCDRNSRGFFVYRRLQTESRRGVGLSDGRSVIQGRLCIVQQILVVLFPETFCPLSPLPPPSLRASSRGSGRMRACSQATPFNTRTNGVSPGGAPCDGIEWNSIFYISSSLNQIHTKLRTFCQARFIMANLFVKLILLFF